MQSHVCMYCKLIYPVHPLLPICSLQDKRTCPFLSFALQTYVGARCILEFFCGVLLFGTPQVFISFAVVTAVRLGPASEDVNSDATASTRRYLPYRCAESCRTGRKVVARIT